MRRPGSPWLPVLLAAALAWGGALPAALALAGETAAPAAAAPNPAPRRPLFAPTPFGPGYDPMRPEPLEPLPAGKGIEAATLVAAGPARVEELRGAEANDAETANLFGAILDVRIASASTIVAFDAAGITLHEGGDRAPQGVYALCLPGAEPPLAMTRSLGVRMDDWHIAVGDRALHCGGRNIRLASRVGDGGVTVTTLPTAPWQGIVVLLFRTAPAGAAELKVAGFVVKLPAPPKADAAGN